MVKRKKKGTNAKSGAGKESTRSSKAAADTASDMDLEAGGNGNGAGGRASAEAIQKRRIARRLNDLLSGRGSSKVDGRTEKRRQRLLEELEKGSTKEGDGLKPIEVLQRVHDLLELGESIARIRQACKGRTHSSLISADRAVEVLRQVHEAYSFRAEAYRFLNVPHEVLVEAGLLDASAPRRGRPKKGSAGGASS